MLLAPLANEETQVRRRTSTGAVEHPYYIRYKKQVFEAVNVET